MTVNEAKATEVFEMNTEEASQKENFTQESEQQIPEEMKMTHSDTGPLEMM